MAASLTIVVREAAMGQDDFPMLHRGIFSNTFRAIFLSRQPS